jgi:predicted DNA-binding transcriptional regulator YafY
MRRADRLFQIIQILRRSTRPVTAAALAEELETSKRSIYRDIAALIGQRVPIRGEAGFGYVLEGGFDLPPLMLTTEEVEAAVLGAQWVVGHADEALAKAAQDLIAKIAASVPEGLRAMIHDSAARTPPSWDMKQDAIDVSMARAWARKGRKIALTYRDAKGALTERIIWPVAIAYFEAARFLVGWCELRQDFRDFRVDRVVAANFLEERCPRRPADLRREWMARLATRSEQRTSLTAGEAANRP